MQQSRISLQRYFHLVDYSSYVASRKLFWRDIILFFLPVSILQASSIYFDTPKESAPAATPAALMSFVNETFPLLRLSRDRHRVIISC